MVKKMIGKLLFAVVILFALTFFVFSLSNMVKGNALDVILSDEISMSQKRRMRCCTRWAWTSRSRSAIGTG